eukprot:2429-Heterococcus_DN1.PRE.2
MPMTLLHTRANDGTAQARQFSRDNSSTSAAASKQAATATVSNTQVSSRTHQLAGVDNSASSYKAEGSYVYGNSSSSNNNRSAINSDSDRGRMSHAVKPSTDSSRDAIYEYEADDSNDSGNDNDEGASEANVCTTGSKQQHSYSCVKDNGGGNSSSSAAKRAVMCGTAAQHTNTNNSKTDDSSSSDELAANYNESSSSDDDSDADSTNAMRHGNNKTAAEYIPAVERSEPSSQTKAVFKDSYYSLLNRECPHSSADSKSGSQLKALIADIRASSAMQSAAQRERLCSQLHDLRTHWAKTSSHSRKSAVACRHTVMPREALPRLVSPCSNSADRFPYIAQQTASDVRAMRAVRSRANGSTIDSARWDVLQQRLQQYAASGAGTIAEAIFCNDCFWLGHEAHERPSGGKAKAEQNRQKKNGRRKR